MLTPLSKKFLRVIITEETNRDERDYWLELIPHISNQQMHDFIKKTRPKQRKILQLSQSLISRLYG
jgi:hypothetical protein